MRILLAVWLVAGYALLTWARIPVFSSDRALWMAALPSSAPRVSINIAAALIQDREWEIAAAYSLAAVELSARQASAFENRYVREIAARQLRFIDAWYPVCDRPDYSPLCS